MSHSLEYKMYLCLLSYPCRCQKRWQDGMAHMVTVTQCQRCKLVKRYETEVLALEEQM